MNELSGKSLNWIKKLYGTEDPDFPNLSVEDKQKLAEMFEKFRPKLNVVPGQIIIVGTAGDMETGSLENIFKKKW